MSKTGWISSTRPDAEKFGEVTPGRIPRHKFSKEIQEELTRLRKLDNWHGLAALVTDWTVIILAALCGEVLNDLSSWASWIFYLGVALPVIGTRQRALATLLHESAHDILAKNKRLNRFLGTCFSGYMIFQSYNAYRRSHVRDHHGSFGDPRIDPDLRAHISAGLYEPQSGAKFRWRYLISPLFGRQTPSVVKELVTARLSGTRKEAIRGISVVAYVACIGGAFCRLWTV